MESQLIKQTIFHCELCQRQLTGIMNETVVCEGCDSKVKIVSDNTTMVLYVGKIKQSVEEKSKEIILAGALILGVGLAGMFFERLKRK